MASEQLAQPPTLVFPGEWRPQSLEFLASVSADGHLAIPRAIEEARQTELLQLAVRCERIGICADGIKYLRRMAHLGEMPARQTRGFRFTLASPMWTRENQEVVRRLPFPEPLRPKGLKVVFKRRL